MARLRRLKNELFRFLEHIGLPTKNNHAERQICPTVIMRKKAMPTAATQVLGIIVFQTLKQRGLNPIEVIQKTLKI